MPKAPKPAKMAFYAVHVGEKPGVYNSWEECEKQVKGFPKPSFKKFNSMLEAEMFYMYGPSKTSISANPHLSSSSSATASAAGMSTATTSTTTALSTKKTYRDRKLEKRKSENEIINEDDWDVVYTDGACHGNGKNGAVAGIGVWWGENDPRNISERCPGVQTNNRAELIAIIRLLETHLVTGRPLLIKTDSSYSISCVRDWLPNWKKRNWKTASNTDVKNKEIIVYLSNLLDERAQKGQVVKFQHVRGHQGLFGNEKADELARGGCSFPPFEREFASPRRVDETSINPYEFDVGDLLSPEELQKMEETGVF